MPKLWTNVTGQTFGALTVLHCNFPPRKRALVRCQCGKEFAVGIGSLTRGKTSSCGATLCSTRGNNLLQKRFGHLVVEQLAPEKCNSRGELMWICKCDCGNLKRVKGSYLLNAGVSSCGCKTSILRSLSHRKSIEDLLTNSQWCAYTASAKSRNLIFTLNKDDFRNLLFKNCTYCGVKPYAIFVRSFIDGKSETVAWNGIDRVDSTKGYTPENCVTCCKICNAAKSNLTYEEFASWVKRLTANFKV